MTTGFDLSVNNYSTEDILSLLGLGTNPSITEINNKINIFVNMFREIDDDNNDDNEDDNNEDDNNDNNDDNNDNNKNIQLIIDFFHELESRLYKDLFENIEINAENYSDYIQPHNINNGLDVSRPFPSVANNYNNFNPEELVTCEKVNIIEEDNVPGRQDFVTINDDLNFKKIHINFEFSTNNLLFVTENCKTNDNKSVFARTTFKYRFNQQLNNIIELFLSQIIIPMPYTVSDYKNNNIITITIGGNDHVLEIDNIYLIYYTDIISFVNYLNNKLIPNNTILSSTPNNFNAQYQDVGNNRYRLIFSGNSQFSMTFSSTTNGEPLHPSYALHKLLGFDQVTINASNPSSGNYIIEGERIFLDQPRLCLTLDDNTVNYRRNLEINGDYTIPNILGILSLTAADLAANDHILNISFSITDRTEYCRKYNGLVNLDTITIKFRDVHGILQQIPKEGLNRNNFTFIINVTQKSPDINGTNIVEEPNYRVN